MLEIYLNTWGNYNENGADGGEWVTLPMDPDELDETMDRIASEMGDSDPEWFINDYQWTGEIDFDDVNESDSIIEWNEILQDADGLKDYELEEIAAAMNAGGYTLREAIEMQQSGDIILYHGMDLEDVAIELVQDLYFSKDTPEIFERYFDYAAFGRDLGFDGYTETEWGVVYIG